MKKLFISILALAAFAACQSGFDGADSNVEFPQFGTNNGGEHSVFTEVGIGEATKAGYDENLAAIWEENDQIALLQEHADYDKTFTTVNKLNIKEGWGTNSARFNGEAFVDSTDPRIYHIVYPASAASFGVSSSLTLVGDISYENNSPIAGYQLKASGVYNYTYNSTLNVIVPTTQKGKWEPYMYASTSEAVSTEYIGAKRLTTLTGAIGILAFEADGTTPKQLKSLAIIASKPIAGAFTGTSTSVGSLGVVTGDETAWHTSFEENSAKSKARASLESKAQGMEPASTSVTKAMSLSFAGSETTVSAEDLETIAADSNGNYTYYLNVAPFEGAEVTIIATAVDGSTAIKTSTINKVEAGQRVRGAIVWESASLTCGSIETWYEDWNTSSFELAGSTIYANNLKVEGVAADHIVSMGLVVNDVVYGEQSGVLEISQIKVEGLASGKYTAYAYAKVMVNGEEKTYTASVGEYTVTTIPTLNLDYIQSSYSKNGAVAKTNDLAGDLLKVKADISDTYIKNNLVSDSKYEIYNNSSKLGEKTLGVEWSTNVGYSALGQYNCYVKISLANGYVLTSPTYATHITGIPCVADWTSADYNYFSLVTSSDNGKNIKVAKNKTGGFFTPTFNLPASVNVTVKYAASSLQPTESKRKVYIAVVSGGTTSLSTSNSDTFRYHNEADFGTTSSYKTWSKTSLSIGNSQKVSAAFNAGTIYDVFVHKFSVEYK